MKTFKIGRRNVKTAIAVFLALFVKVLLMLCIDLPTKSQWSKIIYTPFFGGIAAAYSMHVDKQASLKQAKIRTMGSIIGGLYGMVILIIVEALLVQVCNMDTSGVAFYLTDYTIVAAAIVIMIYLTVVTNMTYATWIACLTYLSVTVSIRNDFDAQLVFTSDANANSYLVAIVFALNRILSTVIGVAISLGVNMLRMPGKRNGNILFVSSLDKSILNSEHKISGFTKYKINQLSGDGCNLIFATTRTQASLNYIFEGISVKMPLITMNGATIYNPKDKHYTSVDYIDPDARHKLDELFKERDINAFCYSVDDDILQIYHGPLKNDGEKKYYSDRRAAAFDNYVRGALPEDMCACFYEIVDVKEKILSIVEIIEGTDYAEKLDLLYYEFDMQGYYFLKINSRSSNKYTRLEELRAKTKADKLVVFGGGSSDLEMMQMADISLCLKSAPDVIKNAATKVLNTADPDAVLKTIEKIYRTKNFEGYKQKLLKS